jgi:hypothetical protein
MAHHLYVAAIRGALFLDYHYAVKRLLFGAEPRQTNHQH